MPIEKENEVREKARLVMERVRHGLDISTDTASDPNRVDDITTSTLEPLVKWLRPTDPTQVPTSVTVSNQQSINEPC